MRHPYISTVIRVGTSLGVIIPRDICSGYEIARGDRVLIICDDPDGFRLVPIDADAIARLGAGEISVRDKKK